MLGINSDPPEKLKQIIEEKKVTWRCFADGEPPGPIAREWNVHGWPTAYLIDQKGIIRMKGHGADPAPLVKELLAGEGETAGKPAAN